MNRTEPKDVATVSESQIMAAADPRAAFAEALLRGAKALGDAIRELGRVPAGNLYAAVMGKMSLPAFERMIEALVSADLVVRQGDMLVWVDEKEAR